MNDHNAPMLIQVDKATHVPIHYQIKEQVIALVQAGKLKPGDQLPTIRALAIDLAVNVNTVAHAYRELDAERVITTRRGEGTFVAGLPGTPDLRGQREQKLKALVAALFTEAGHLGYSLNEVEQAVRAHLQTLREEQ